MRTLDEIVAAVRSNETYTEDELVYAVVAFDVLLSQLALDQDATRLQHWMAAAVRDPREYVGEANDPANSVAVDWYRSMHNVKPEACNCGEVPKFIECPYHPGEDE